VLGEQAADVIFGGAEGQIAHIHFRVHFRLLGSVSLRQGLSKLRYRISEHQRNNLMNDLA
jgi:hypothetical protein